MGFAESFRNGMNKAKSEEMVRRMHREFQKEAIALTDGVERHMPNGEFRRALGQLVKQFDQAPGGSD